MLNFLFIILFFDTLKINISGWKETSRCIGVAIYDEEGFKKDIPNYYSTYKCFEDRKSDNILIEVPSPPQEGKYVIAIFQDLNGNKKLDKNTFGIPVEPYVFSGKVKSKWKKPIFNEVSFIVRKPMEPLKLELKNWEEY